MRVSRSGLMSGFRPVRHPGLQLLIRIMEEKLGHIDLRLDFLVQMVIEREVNAVTCGGLVALGTCDTIEIDGLGVLPFGISVKADGQVVEMLS
jgi:N-acetylglutamate synthase-like GNAT family acetyltransferase